VTTSSTQSPGRGPTVSPPSTESCTSAPEPTRATTMTMVGHPTQSREGRVRMKATEQPSEFTCAMTRSFRFVRSRPQARLYVRHRRQRVRHRGYADSIGLESGLGARQVAGRGKREHCKWTATACPGTIIRAIYRTRRPPSKLVALRESADPWDRRLPTSPASRGAGPPIMRRSRRAWFANTNHQHE
jgi:hypothetical protein